MIFGSTCLVIVAAVPLRRVGKDAKIVEATILVRTISLQNLPKVSPLNPATPCDCDANARECGRSDAEIRGSAAFHQFQNIREALQRHVEIFDGLWRFGDRCQKASDMSRKRVHRADLSMPSISPKARMSEASTSQSLRHREELALIKTSS